MLRLCVGVAASLFAISCVAQDFRDTFTSVTPKNFDSGGEISRQFHLNAESYFTMATIARQTETRELTLAPSPALAKHVVSHNGFATSFAEYVSADPLLDGVVVLHNGKIVFEAYPKMHPWRRHFAWSVTKVVTSTALAVLVERGQVDMSAAVGSYVPALKDSAWGGIALRDVANMASGIDCLDSDGYQDPTTCIYTMEESLGITAPTGREPDFVEHLQGMQVHRAAGIKNEYVSANTNVLMLVIEAVTGKPYATVLQELLWNPIGAEADALIAISKSGYAYASGGLHARLRDVARFGQIYTHPELSGALSQLMISKIQNEGVALSPDRLKEDLGEDVPTHSGWQWDHAWADGAMYKAGYSGQGIYVDPARDLVVAWFGTGLDYEKTVNGMLPVSRQIARSGLFDYQASHLTPDETE
ncbi:MAG: beta-lactamase family protein [Gammaproteobacteria bacterium]|nr:beta-lactamase family protein [Gammaproteobacteria bacterium]